MNKYDEVYEFRKATVNDVDSIMAFIKNEWSENHILGKDKELFLWQYGRNEYGDNNSINFVLMHNKQGDLLGMIGFVAYDRDDYSISPAMTKVKPHGLLPMTGLEFMKREMNIVGEKYHFASGTNTKTILPLYEKVFHHYSGYMQQYYMLNPKFASYNIALPKKNEKILPFIDLGYKLNQNESFEEAARLYDFNECSDMMHSKSAEFIDKRYYKHPIYKYKKWFVNNQDNKIVGMLFGREISINESKILRLVDFRGKPEDICNLGRALHDLMNVNDYEYIDLMVSDMSGYALDKAGFSLLDPDGETIVPHYFEPFVRENIKNWYQTNSKKIIFKADGDQDRPNHR